MDRTFSHAAVFPLVARPIVRAPADDSGFVDHETIVSALLSDTEGNSIVTRASTASSLPDPPAQKERWEGASYVRVEFGVGVVVKSISVNPSSGYAVLDQRAIELVRAVMPTVPDELRDHDFVIRFPIVFKLVSPVDLPRRFGPANPPIPGRQ